MADIEDGIYARLSNHAGLSALVGNRIWPTRARDNAAAPYVVFHIRNRRPTSAMVQDSNPVECRLAVTVYAANKPSAMDVSTQVRDALQRYSGSEGGVTVQACFYDDEDDNFDFDPDEFEQELEFVVWYEE